MADKKITQLTAASEVESSDILPVVDISATETKKVTMSQILDYITGSTFNILTSSNITGSDAKFTSMSGNLDWSYIVNEPTFLTTNQTITLDGDAAGSGTTTISVSNITASYVTASNIDNFTADVRAQFTAGTNITINNGEISAPAGSDIAASDNTFTATNTFDNFYITASSGITGSDGKFTSITSSYFNSQDPAVFVNSAGVTGNTSAFTFKTDASVSGYLFSLKHNNTEQFYMRYDGYAYFNDTVTVQNSQVIRLATVGSTSTALWESRLKPAQFGASGSAASNRPAVRIGSQNIDSNEKVLSISKGLYNAYYPSQTTTDVVDVYGNGDVDVSGSLIANVRVSGSIASPIDVTSYTLSSADRGKTLLFSSSATQDITCSSGLDVGYNCTFIQMGSGQLILSGASGVELFNRQSQTGSAGLYAAVSVVVVDTDKIIVAGDTA